MNKFHIIFLLGILMTGTPFAQDNVGIGTTTPHPQAILELVSSNQGFLMSRMNVADTAVAGMGQQGMMFFAQDVQAFLFYDGTSWQSISTGVNYWGENGTDIFNLNTGGVGIGTNSTALMLQVAQNLAGANPVMAIENQNSSGDVSYGFLNSGSATSYTMGVDGSDANKFKISNNPSLGTNDRLTLDGGSVGIGTNTPVNSLDINGSVAIGSGYAGSTAAFSNGLIIEGDVGIGATTQIGAGRLTISESVAAYSGMYINTLAAGRPFYGYALGGAGIGWTYVDGTDANKWKLNLSGDRLTITTTGLMGIGTTTPVNTLDIEGGLAVGATYSGSSTAPTNGAIIEGNVGIGTNLPTSQLHLNTVNATSLRLSNTNTSNGVNAATIELLEDNLVFGTNALGSRIRYDGSTNNLVLEMGNGATVNTGLTIARSTGNVSLANGAGINEFSIDGTLGDNSNTAVPTEAAVRTYVSNSTPEIAFGAYRSSSLSVPTATSTEVIFNLEEYDFGADYNTSTGRFVVPLSGLYQFNAAFTFSSGGIATGNQYVIDLEVNGSRIKYVSHPTGPVSWYTLHISSALQLTVGDQVGISVYQNTGSNRTILTGSFYTWFNGYKVK